MLFKVNRSASIILEMALFKHPSSISDRYEENYWKDPGNIGRLEGVLRRAVRQLAFPKGEPLHICLWPKLKSLVSSLFYPPLSLPLPSPFSLGTEPTTPHMLDDCSIKIQPVTHEHVSMYHTGTHIHTHTYTSPTHTFRDKILLSCPG